MASKPLLLFCFSFQLALYCRNDLNLRTVANVLLALAALHPHCRPHLARYLSAVVRLPTDWVAVADLVQTFQKENSPEGLADNAGGSLPAALRKAMVTKFSDFDEYQLAKHNKKPKQRQTARFSNVDDDVESMDSGSVVEDEEAEEDEEMGMSKEERDRREKLRARGFSLKRLIRVLHINSPKFHVMALLGKK